MTTEQRIYRVQATAPDGSLRVRDYLTKDAAEAAAASLIKPRIEPGPRGHVVIPAHTNVRIIRSEPIFWEYHHDD